MRTTDILSSAYTKHMSSLQTETQHQIPLSKDNAEETDKRLEWHSGEHVPWPKRKSPLKIQLNSPK